MNNLNAARSDPNTPPPRPQTTVERDAEPPTLGNEPVVTSEQEALYRAVGEEFTQRMAGIGDGIVRVDIADVVFTADSQSPDEVTVRGPDGYVNVQAHDGQHWTQIVGAARPEHDVTQPLTTRADLTVAAAHIGVSVEQLAPIIDNLGQALGDAREELDTALEQDRTAQESAALHHGENGAREEHIDPVQNNLGATCDLPDVVAAARLDAKAAGDHDDRDRRAVTVRSSAEAVARPDRRTVDMSVVQSRLASLDGVGAGHDTRYGARHHDGPSHHQGPRY